MEIELIRKKKFAVAILDPNYEAFVVYILALNINLDSEVHLLKRAQIAYLKADEGFTEVFHKYIDFKDVFLSKLTVELPDYTDINDHAIKLTDNWQLFYSLIYSLGPVEFKILKTYIKNNLANGFIRPFKSATTAIFVDMNVGVESKNLFPPAPGHHLWNSYSTIATSVLEYHPK